MKAAIVFGALGLTVVNTSIAQTSDNRNYVNRKSFWFEGNINGSIRRNSNNELIWQYQLDYQYRRGADGSNVSRGSYTNIFKDMQQNVLRPWIHYYPVPGKIRISVSPLGHWGSWTPSGDGAVKYYHEFRSSYQLTFYQKFGRIELQHRYRYERRWVGNKELSQGGFNDLFSQEDFFANGRKNRLRYLMRANIPLNKSGSNYLAIWDEIFIGFGKNVANNKIFDQNRLVCLFGRKINQDSYPMKIEAGLLWQSAPKYDNPALNYQNWENNLAFNVYLIFDEFHKFRGINRKKKNG